MAPISLPGFLGSKSETSKIEPILVDSLASPLALERRRMENRLVNVAKKETRAIVQLLLRNLDNEVPRVHESIEKCLVEIAKRNEGRESIVDSLNHPEAAIRKGAKIIIPEVWGVQATPYATLYEQVFQLLETAREKDIPLDDIEVLMGISQQVLLDGEVMKAINDIGKCLEFARRRYKNSESLKEYISDMLKMAPELHRMGVSIVNFEESLKTAIKASRTRTYDFTQEIIDQRVMEMEVKDQLRNVGQLVKESIKARPSFDMDVFNPTDRKMVMKMTTVLDTINTKNLSGNLAKSIEDMHAFLLKDFEWYYNEDVMRRLGEGERSAHMTIYLIGISFLKVASVMMPSVAEDIYQRYFRELEGATSIYTVFWPEVVMELIRGMKSDNMAT